MPYNPGSPGGLQAFGLDTPEVRRAELRSQMKPGDYLMDDENGRPMIVRHAQRDIDQSVLNTVGQFADKYMGFGDDRRRSRVLSGVASQWYGLDEAGNPTFGETPGIVHETKALGTLPTTLARAGVDAYTGWFAKNFMGIPPEKALQDPLYNLVKKELLSDPEWATKAAEKADAIHKAVREDMRLKTPKGPEQNFAESLGVMLGQLPVPGKAATKVAEGATKAPGVLRRLEQGAEWFTPTVEAKPLNYVSGAAVGAGIGTLGDEDEVPTILPGDQPGLYDVRPVYSDGTVGFSGNAIDQEALKQLEAQEAEGDDTVDKCDGGMATVRSMKAKYAEGGKVNNALKAIKDAIAHLDNGDTGSALRTLNASPDALRDPQIAEAMKKLRHPTTSKVGRKVLDSAVAADTNATKVATFKKGGKVGKSADAIAARAKKLLKG